MVVFVQLKPIPSSQETSAIRVGKHPGPRSANTSVVDWDFLERDHDVAFGQEGRQLEERRIGDRDRTGESARMDGRTDGGAPAVGQALEVMDAVGDEGVVHPRAVAPKPMTTALSLLP